VFVFGDLQTPATPVGRNPGNWLSIMMDLKDERTICFNALPAYILQSKLSLFNGILMLI